MKFPLNQFLAGGGIESQEEEKKQIFNTTTTSRQKLPTVGLNIFYSIYSFINREPFFYPQPALSVGTIDQI
jgi:hypothetical protein